MNLPLIERAKLGSETYTMTSGAACLVQIGVPKQTLIPERKPGPGEQYRFHFDMRKCVGCKCCVVACNEQNGNPAELNWRRVGEMEGGVYPQALRLHLSMGCNHCLEPSCMKGCPVEAYTKRADNGVVVHNADTCIGCQYCTWNCSYGVPQYNAARGVVGKCDMCHNRLADGDAPACVQACPQGAIEIEIVNQAEWRRDHGAADAPGLPSAADSISTTRVTMPEKMLAEVARVDTNRVFPEHPHWPLVVMLTLTQMSVGVFCVLWILGLSGHGGTAAWTALGGLAVASLALGASTLHLGRPIHAYRAIRGWRRSWLSREVLTFSMFAGAAGAYAGALLGVKWVPALGEALGPLGAATVLAGVAGITSSALIYMVPARPAWASVRTWVEFMATMALLGPLAVRAAGAEAAWLKWAAAAGAGVVLVNLASKLEWLRAAEAFELRASAQLLGGPLRRALVWRVGLVLVGGLALPFSGMPGWLALGLGLLGEGLGRWLFFVSVVPKNIAAAFLREERG